LSEKKSVIKNIYFQVIEKGTRSSLGFITNIISARVLSVEMFGYLGIITSFYNVFAFIGSSSIDSRIVSNILKSEQIDQNDILKYYWSKFIISYASASAMLIAAYFIFGAGLIPFFLVIGIRFAFQPLFIFDQICEAEGLVRIVSKVKICAIIAATLLKFLLLLLGFEIYGILIGSVCEALICAGIYLKFYPRLLSTIRFSFARIKCGLNFIAKLKWSAVSSLMIAIMINFDKTLLFKITNDGLELGYYNAGVSIPQFLLVASPILISSAFPYILKSKNKLILIANYANYILAFGMILSGLISLFSQEICIFLYGKNYIQSSEIMAVSSVMLPGFFLYMMKMRVIAHLANNSVEAIVSLVGLLIFIISALILTKFYGAIGMAASMSMTYTILGIYSYIKVINLKNGKYI
jgi:O-antigen/teichoic acid export membrane protein